MKLKPLRKRLEEISKKTFLRLDVIQQDYLLSWVLVGLFEHPLLKSELIFKGGTALKKCYFGDYRFSEDLDFTALPYFPKGDLLIASIKQVCKDTEQKMNLYSPIQLFVEKYEERDPHPQQQEAFKIKAQFPWQHEPLTTVMIEISRDETILFHPKMKNIYHDYGETFDTKIAVYSIEEIILEKLRAILQHTKKLHERDWNRSRARDYYDLWRIFNQYENDLVFDDFFQDLERKCAPKRVSFESFESFFDPVMTSNVAKTWDQWLGPLIKHLPKYELVMKELRLKLEGLFQRILS